MLQTLSDMVVRIAQELHSTEILADKLQGKHEASST